LQPPRHCMNSGGELFQSTVPRDSACIMIWPKFARGPPPGQALVAAAPALPEQRRRAGQEHRAEGQRVHQDLAEVHSWTSSRSGSRCSRSGLHEQRRRAGQEHRAEGQSVHQDLAEFHP
jgi:hypothetical protein